jgi:hypothetical protein
VTYMGNLGATVTGIAMRVVRNNLGQTACYSTAGVSSQWESGTAELVLFGLPPVNYSATFAFTFSGVAVSTSATVPFIAEP